MWKTVDSYFCGNHTFFQFLWQNKKLKRAVFIWNINILYHCKYCHFWTILISFWIYASWKRFRFNVLFNYGRWFLNSIIEKKQQKNYADVLFKLRGFMRYNKLRRAVKSCKRLIKPCFSSAGNSSPPCNNSSN